MSETLLNEIRATRPAAPTALRERVRALVRRGAGAGALSRPSGSRGAGAGSCSSRPPRWSSRSSRRSVIGLTRDDVVGGERRLGSAVRGAADATATTEAFTRARRPRQRRARALAPTRPLRAPTRRRRSRRRPASCSATRPSCACASTTSRRSRTRRSAPSRSRPHGGSVASLQYDAPSEGVGSAQIALRIPTARVQGALAQLSAARHDRRPALRDRGPAAAGRQPADADRADAAADRADPRPARERDALGREPGRAAVAADVARARS